MSEPIRVAVKTVGCRLNQAESATLSAGLQAAGLSVVKFGLPCEACVIHSCAITANAERTVNRLVRAARRFQERPLVIVIGCAVEIGRERVAARSGADLLLDQSEKWSLPERLSTLFEISGGGTPPEARETPLLSTARASLKIQDGCDGQCSYCVVPLARGAPRSRPIAEIVNEAQRLVAAGYRELVLVGANLARYEWNGLGLADVLNELESVPGLPRLRIGSLEPGASARRAIERMAASPRLCPFLHIPLQSGDDGVLRAMKRPYTADEYRSLALLAHRSVPDLGLGTDVIVGFPGETEEAFENTLRLVEELPFGNIHVFSFSPRPNTAAADLRPRVDRATVAARSRRLTALGVAKRRAFANGFLGRDCEMLVESVRNGRARGWTRSYIEAECAADGARRGNVHRFVPRSLRGVCLVD